GRYAATLLAGMKDGFRLRCPSCGEGRIFERGFATRHACPVCSAPFERAGEGDFLLAMILVYGVASVIVTTLTLLLYRFTDWGLGPQLAVTISIGVAFVVLLYRNLKGVWIAVLIALTKWGVE